MERWNGHFWSEELNFPQMCKRAFARSDRKRRNRRRPVHLHEQLLCPGSAASPWFAASCCRDGRWPSFSRFFGSRQQPLGFPPMDEHVAGTHAWTYSTNNASVREGIAAQLILFNHLHLPVFILVWLVTYPRPPEPPAPIKKGLVSLLVPLPPY